MTQSAPSTWRAVLMYTAFDLRNLPLARVFLILGLPVFIIGSVSLTVGTMAWSTEGLLEEHIVIVAPDEETRDSLNDWFSAPKDGLEVRLPSDPEAVLGDDGVDVIAVVSSDYATTATIEISADAFAQPGSEANFRRRIHRWLVEEWATAVAGPRPKVSLERPSGEAVTLEKGDSPQEGLASGLADIAGGEAPQHMVGLFVIGMFSLMFGLLVGNKIAKSGREGFNNVLAVGTPKRAIYLSEMLTGSVLALAQALSWWLLYAIFLTVAGGAAGIEVPTLASLAPGAPLIALMAACALVQACAFGLLMSQMGQALPRQVRDRSARLAGLALLALFIGLDIEFSATLLGRLSLLPVIGPLALWSFHVEGGTWVPLLAALQLVYALLALQLGAWIFLLDESPITYLRRRYLSTSPGP